MVPNTNNSLFIGKEHLSIDGRDIKHMALIKTFGRFGPNKTQDDPMTFIGMDLETNHITGELKLLGFWEDEAYKYYTNHFISVLYKYVRKSIYDDKRIVWWNRLDPFIIFKQFLLQQEKTAQIERSMKMYGKIGGHWDKKEGKWTVKPVVSVIINDTHEFGIMNAIRSSIQFYIKDGEEVKTTWAYDVAGMYMSGLEKEAGSRFPWYSKVDKSAHLVDWVKFDIDGNYAENIVLKSNMFDARAVHDLAHETLNQFYKAFKHYPKNLISQGSLARSALVSQLKNMDLDPNEYGKRIGLKHHLDPIVEQLGPKKAKDFFALITEAYSAGYIEAIRFGSAKKGAYADIASAYPAVIVNLYDLEGATYTSGKGTPKKAEKGYTFIRGQITVPKDNNFNPITIKHPVHTSTNIRASGTYIASYTIEEREFMIAQGATFENESWVMIETNGELSPLAKVAKEFIDLRKRLLAEKDSAQYMAKIASNSLYGILFECVNTYEEETVKRKLEEEVKDTFYQDILKDYRKKIDFTGIERELKKYFDNEYHKIRSMWHGKTGISPDVVKGELEEAGVYIDYDHPADILYEINRLYRLNKKFKTIKEYEEEVVFKAGYRAGEFFNPIFATYITAQTRIKLASASVAIEDNGGKVIALMTDSITWEGKPEQLPQEYWMEEKTLGYFEKPEVVTDIISLGAGRYEFTDDTGRKTTKRRGIDSISDFNWKDLLDKAVSNQVHMKTRLLVSVGLILGNHEFNYKDLGRVVETEREVDLVVGLTKRPLVKDLNFNELRNKLVDTESFMIHKYMLGENDMTLPNLRSEMSKRPYKLMKEQRRDNSRKTSLSHYRANKLKINEKRRYKYAQKKASQS